MRPALVTDQPTPAKMAVGNTIICRWKNGATGAYSIGGDDSLNSQLDYAIPAMTTRGFYGTWWINPARGGADDVGMCWLSRRAEWEAAARAGHNFGNHSLHHTGAKDYAEAEDEIKETARAIWTSNPGQQLQLFMRGGGTTWHITDAQFDELCARYDCFQGRGGGVEDPSWNLNPNAATLRGYVDQAISEGGWHHVAVHGIGPNSEWGGWSSSGFMEMLDYLVQKREAGLLWVASHLEVHQYDQERSTASVDILEASTTSIRLNLTCAKPLRLYDHPLTLRTRVPEGWMNTWVTQNGASAQYAVNAGVIQYSAVPGLGEIIIKAIR
jgi:hypothetical protein